MFFSKWLSDAAGLDQLPWSRSWTSTTRPRAEPDPDDLTNQFKSNYAYDSADGDGHLIHLTHGWNRLLNGWTTKRQPILGVGQPLLDLSGLGHF